MRKFLQTVVTVLALATATSVESQGLGTGWSALEDPLLVELLDQALSVNTDVRVAAARVEAARATAGLARHDRWPTGGIAVSSQRVSPARDAVSSGAATDDSFEVATAGADVGWEVDLFGRLRGTERAARARAAVRAEELEAVRISIASEVATTYFVLRAAREQRAIRARYQEHQTEIVALSEALVAEGRLARGELARARAELASDVAEVEAAEDEAVRLEAALAVLIGQLPGQWRLPESREPGPLQFRSIALPAAQDLLRRRPDVRAAERRLQAESAEVTAAAAARYPRLDLFGVFGFLAGGFADLGRAGTDSWSVGGVLRWNVLDLPRINARVRVEEAETDEALAALDGAMLRAIEEAENAVRRYGSAYRQAEARVTQARQARTAADAAQARYEEGATAYLDALQARRDALGADLAAARAVAGQRVAVVGLLKALAVPVQGGAG